jgi:hypothetical protein
MSKEDPRAKQTHHRRHRFEHRKTVLLRPARTKRRTTLHSQKDSLVQNQMGQH